MVIIDNKFLLFLKLYMELSMKIWLIFIKID